MKTKTPWACLNRSAHSGSELSVNQPSEIAADRWQEWWRTHNEVACHGWRCGGKSATARGNSGRIKALLEQRLEARLLEMVITRQCMLEPLVTHDDERDAVGQRPALVGPRAIERDSLFQQRARRGHHSNGRAKLDVTV